MDKKPFYIPEVGETVRVTQTVPRYALISGRRTPHRVPASTLLRFPHSLVDGLRKIVNIVAV